MRSAHFGYPALEMAKNLGGEVLVGSLHCFLSAGGVLVQPKRPLPPSPSHYLEEGRGIWKISVRQGEEGKSKLRCATVNSASNASHFSHVERGLILQTQNWRCVDNSVLPLCRNGSERRPPWSDKAVAAARMPVKMQ